MSFCLSNPSLSLIQNVDLKPYITWSMLTIVYHVCKWSLFRVQIVTTYFFCHGQFVCSNCTISYNSLHNKLANCDPITRKYSGDMFRSILSETSDDDKRSCFYFTSRSKQTSPWMLQFVEMFSFCPALLASIR